MTNRNATPWVDIIKYVVQRLRDGENVSALAAKSGVGVWWLIRVRAGKIKEPGWDKFGRVFEALGGRPPKIPSTSKRSSK